jgi:hypothetical protein
MLWMREFVVHRMIKGITPYVTCGVKHGTAGRVNRPMAGVVTGPVAVRVAGEAARQVHGGAMTEIALRMVWDATV